MSSKKRVAEDSDTDQKESPNTTKKIKHAVSADGEDDDGNPFWELSNKRRVGVSQFKNLHFVNIREYYEKDGKTLPGKKGISLSVEQYTALLKAVPAINATLQKMGHTVQEAEGVSDVGVKLASKPKKEKSKPSKANIDATSDEDED